MLCANPQSQFCKQIGLPTCDPYFSQIPLFYGLSILLIIPKRQSLVGNNLSLLILCTWVPNQELPSITDCVLFLFEPATTNGEERASWPPGVVVNGFILYSSSLFDPMPPLVWLAWADGETPAQKIVSNMHCVVWLSCLLFRSDIQITRVVKSLTKL